jgi:hypothetical protein
MGVRLGELEMTHKHLFCTIWSCWYVESLMEHQTGAAYDNVDRIVVVYKRSFVDVDNVESLARNGKILMRFPSAVPVIRFMWVE